MAFTIRNQKDLELAYMYVNLFSDKENTKDPETAKKHVIETKREIRRYLKQDESDRRPVKSFDDSYIELVELP